MQWDIKNRVIMKPNKTQKATKPAQATTTDKQAPKKKFKLHRMTKEELLATRIPVYDYIL